MLRAALLVISLALVGGDCGGEEPPSGCCAVCTKGCPCGDACIDCSKTCNAGAGCACKGGAP